MRRLVALSFVALLALHPLPVRAASAWGSPGYGDPPGWCTKFSDMWGATVVTNDPLVAANPERETFYGFHKNPGYDDWYGFFYGDFRGTPGDASGWVRLLHEDYPHHYHWNFADAGWAVHGHAKEYIAYYNWTFGGQCGLGARGSIAPPPFMADQYGYPVVDIYVDSLPPDPPQPYVMAVAPASVSFTWDAVADRGDGAGPDYFVAGMDHYVSWLTVNDRAGRLQLASTASPRVVGLDDLSSHETACLHVQAVDRVANSTAEQVACSGPLTAPPMPAWGLPGARVEANPSAPGLVGFESWFWLAPSPAAMTVAKQEGAVRYTITATPVGADWDYGDGGTARFGDRSGFGKAYPEVSQATHTFQAHNQDGYVVRGSIRYEVTWIAESAGRLFGPFPLGAVSLDAAPLAYPVEQAQPVLVEV